MIRIAKTPIAILAIVTTGIAVADRKSTRLNSSHGYISYAVFCLKKKTIGVMRLHSTPVGKIIRELAKHLGVPPRRAANDKLLDARLFQERIRPFAPAHADGASLR